MILALSPHPDDVEISVSASLLYTDKRVLVLLLSSGTEGDPGDKGVDRIEEARNFWQCTRVDIEVCLVNFDNLRESLQTVEKFLHERGLDCVVREVWTPTSLDTHQEHVFTGELARALVRDRKADLVEYRTPSTLPEWTPNRFHAIRAEDFEDKVNRLQQIFPSQAKKSFLGRIFLDSFHSHPAAARRGIRYSEQLRDVFRWT